MAGDPNRSGSFRDAARAALAAQDKAQGRETQNRQTEQTPTPKQQSLASQAPMTGDHVAQTKFALEMSKRNNAFQNERFEKKQQAPSRQAEQQNKPHRPNHAALKKEPSRTAEKDQQAAEKSKEAKQRPMTFNCFHDPDHGRGR